MTTMTTTTTVVPEPQEAHAMSTTTVAIDAANVLPGFSAEQLNRLAGIFLAVGPAPAPISVGIAGHSVGRPEVHEVVVRERDLWFLHGLDATRFGAHEDCVLCAHQHGGADIADGE